MRTVCWTSRARRLSMIPAAVMVVSLCLAMLLTGGTAAADPVLNVVDSAGSALIGGTASIQVTVTNTGADRGYNLSLTEVFTSNPLRGDGKNKTVQFVSASFEGNALTPTTQTYDANNALTISIDDIVDLAPTESAVITIVVKPVNPVPPDIWPWAVGDKIHNVLNAKVNTRADGGGSWIPTPPDPKTGDSTLIPIKFLSKSATQSTADKQATGCGELPQGGWPYTYTLEVQNNYTNPVTEVTIPDVLPDGVQYLGIDTPDPIHPAPPVETGPDIHTGQTTLTWGPFNMAAGETFKVVYKTGIRYDYFGTDGARGTNRPYNDYAWPSGFGTPVLNNTTFTNDAKLDAKYLGNPVETQYAHKDVTAAYATINKSVNTGTAGNGDPVQFTIKWRASEYYDTSNYSIVDVVPDGLTYVSASVAPYVEPNTPGPGQTRLTWDNARLVAAGLSPLAAGGTSQITVNATADYTWSVDPAPYHDWIVAGDSITNNVSMSCDWASISVPALPVRTGSITDASSASVVAVGPKPPVSKEVAPDNGGTPGTYGSSINASVGDTLWFRVRVNRDETHAPLVPNVQFGNLDVVDWIPQGTLYTGTAILDYSNKAANPDPPPDFISPDFHYTNVNIKYSKKYNEQPQPVVSGPLQGEAWSLGNVSANGWWQVEFKVVVQDDTSIVKEGNTYYDYGKTSWENSHARQSSDRATAAINYSEPHLAAQKTVTPPAQPGVGQSYAYQIKLTNDGTAPARNVQVTDTLPVGMRGFDPRGAPVTVMRGTHVLSEGTEYTLAYNSGTGQFVISFDNGVGGINTEIPYTPSPTENFITIDYTAKVLDTPNVGAGARLTNNVSATYSAQKSTAPVNRNYAPATASKYIDLPGITIVKSEPSATPVTIGNQSGSVVTYQLTVTVPAYNYAPSGCVLTDVLAENGIDYVSGAGNTLLTDVAGTPGLARFSDPAHRTDMDPALTWNNPGLTLSWSMQNPIDNSANGTDYSFMVQFNLLAQGLKRPASNGGTDIPSNWQYWPNTGGNAKIDNPVHDTGHFTWNNGQGSPTVNTLTKTTVLEQPYLKITKSNNKPYPPGVKAGDVVTYTITVENQGKTTSFDNKVVDALPAGMFGVGSDPVVTSVTLGTSPPVPLADPANYHYSYSSGTLTFDFDGTAHTNILPGATNLLTITYTATVQGNVGSGAILTNNCYCEYYSQDDMHGRHVQNGSDSSNGNRSSSTVRTNSATVTKSIVGTNTAVIGDSITYKVDVIVPEGTNLYPLDANGWTLKDSIASDGIQYNAGSTTAIQWVSGTPATPAAFHNGDPEPGTTYYPPTHAATLTWHLDTVQNPAGGGDYEFYFQFTGHVTGLRDPVPPPPTTDQTNWQWWWATGGNPQANNTANDTARLDWSDGLVTKNSTSSAVTTHVIQPALNLTKSNTAPGGVSGGATINYTTTATNNGLSTSYKNKVVDTLPVGMRQTPPVVTDVRFSGSPTPLTLGVDYWVNWSSPELTIDFDNTTSVTNIAAGAALVCNYSATVDPDIGSGAPLTNIASVSYNSQMNGSGRDVPVNLDVTQHNTKSSTVNVPLASIAKSQNAPANKAAIGQPFVYSMDVTAPAHSSMFDTTVTDTFPDGLSVDSTATYLDTVPTVIGNVAVNPQGDGTTVVNWTAIENQANCWQNATGSNQVLSLRATVHIKNALHGGALVNGIPPGQSTFNNSATVSWNESHGGVNHQRTGSATVVTATEPFLNLGIVNHAGGAVPGDSTVGYTVTVDNAGTSTAYKNQVVITMPQGMQDTSPAITDMRIGAYHFLPSDYSTTYAGGLFTITMLTSNTDIPNSGQFIIDFNGKTDQGVGSGASLPVMASIGYNSWSDGSGRQTDTTTHTSDHNTKDTTITTGLATVAKTQNATGNNVTIGSTYDYTVTVTVPQGESLFSAVVTDNVPDGLTVTDVATTTGSAGHAGNAVTWTIGDYENVQPGPAYLTLTISVRVNAQYGGGGDVERGDTFGNTARLDWLDKPSGGSAHNTSGSATPVTVREPDLAVTKQILPPSSDTPQAGDSVTYTVTITNNGDWPAYDVTVNDSVQSGLTYAASSITGPGANDSLAPALSWDVQNGHGAIQPGAPQAVTLTYRVTVDGGATRGQVIGNTAAVSAYTGGQPAPYGRVYAPESATKSVTVRAPSLGLLKEVTSNWTPDWGEQVGYRVTVTNNGDARANSVVISDTIPSPNFAYTASSTHITWPGGSPSTAEPSGTAPTYTWDLGGAWLDPGQQMVLTFNMTVLAPAAYGVKTNSATGMGTDGAGTALPNVHGSADIDVKQHPGLSVTKTLTNTIPFVPVGDAVTYSMTVTNTGNTSFPVVKLTDTFNETYLQFTSASKTPDSQGAGSLTWNDLTNGAGLAPQQVTTLNVSFKALAPGVTPNTDDTASVHATDDQSHTVDVSDTNTALTITNPDLVITKTLDHPGGIVPVGNGFGYNIHIANTGDTKAMAPVALTDAYNPATVQFLGAAPAPASATAGTINWADASNGAGIAAGASIDVRVNFAALAPGATPSTDDSVSVLAHDEHGAPLADSVTNRQLVVTNPSLSVTKSLGPDQAPQIKNGENVTFRIEVSNTGDTKCAVPVPLTDSYNSAFLSFTSASIDPDAGAQAGTLKWSDLSQGQGILPGGKLTVDVTFKTLQEGTAPNTTDVASVEGCKDQNGDPIAPKSADAYVDVGPNKVLGSTDWFLAEGSTGGGFDTWILLQNPGKVKANAAVTFLTQSGPRPPVYVVVPAESRYTLRIQDFVPNDFHVSTMVKSDAPIVAERSMYWDKRFYGLTGLPGTPQPYEMKAGHSNMGTPLDSVAVARARKTATEGDPGRTAYFPEGSTAPGFDTWVLVCNPGDAGAYVRVRLMTPNGMVDAGGVSVPQHSRYTIHVNQLLPNTDQVAVELDSNKPIVAERSMYWDPNAANLQPYQMKGGSSSPGSDDPANSWYLAEGSTACGFETYVLVQNPGSQPAKVTADFMTSAGVAATAKVNMAAGSRATIKVSDYVPGDFHVATRIVADQPVIAERSMYWDKRVTSQVSHMREGHSAAGVTHTGSLWTVPEGSTGGGFDSWVLISNPALKDTTANVTFMTAQGPTQPMTIRLPASTRYTLRIGDYVPNDFHVSTVIETKGQIVVERAMYWDKRQQPGIQPYEMMGGHSTTGLDP